MRRQRPQKTDINKLMRKEQRVTVPKTVRSILPLVLVALLASVLLACDRTGGGPANTDAAVAATVNGKNIMLREVDALLNQQARAQGVQVEQMSPLELAAARMQVLDGLIQQEVLYQRADREKLLPTEDEVTQLINQQKQQSRMTEEEYQRMLRETNQTEPELREVARRQMAVQRLQERQFGNISISDRDVEDFYNNNRQQFVSARGVALAAIVVDPQDNGATNDARTDVEATQKINMINTRLRTGADFATVARAESEDQSSLRGGDIGFFTEDQLRQLGFPPELIAQFFGPMQVGDITEPRQINNRWYIFKLQRKQLENQNLTLDSPGVREQIKEGLINQRRTILNAALLEVAMNEARITNLMARNMLENVNNLSSLRPAGAQQPPAQGASPAAANTNTAPAASPAQGGTRATPAASPAASPAR